LGLAVAVSVIHYADNYFNYDDFPTTDSIPTPSAAVVGLSWFAFTSAGALGYYLFRQDRRIRPAFAMLAVYSVRWLVVLLHYSASGMVDAPWWPQAHVIADIACGLAIAAFSVWAWRSAERLG